MSQLARIVLPALLLFPVIAAGQANAIQVGAVVIDEPTLCCLGFSLPVSGDENRNAIAEVDFRRVGTTSWRQGMPMLRVRPDTISTETPPSTYGLPAPGHQFAGSIFGLDASATYEVRISVTDPDGGSQVINLTAGTRTPPRTRPANERLIGVVSEAEFSNALANAQAGDVIELANGTYSGAFSINADGTESDPIVIRGESRNGVVIDASGFSQGITLNGDYLTLENLTIRGSVWGVRANGELGIVVRRTRITQVQRGISASGGAKIGFHLCDNLLEGIHQWPDTSSSTWDDEGIAITGQGHVVCHNTLSGFGDALGLSNSTNSTSAAIDFYGNDILWTGDDGIELDFAHRNVRAFENRITNANMGISFQPVWGGPIYAFKNVLINIAAGPYKLNNEPTGFLIFNNTSVRTQGSGNFGSFGLPQLGYQVNGHLAWAANFEFKNNIAIGIEGPARFTSDIIDGEIDYNGWFPDGAFVFVSTWSDLEDLKANSPYGANGRIIEASPFDTPLMLPPSYQSLVTAPRVALSSSSAAIDAGVVLPNLNDSYVGQGPDLGAWERGSPEPTYGVRSAAPEPPTGLTAD